MIKQNLEEIKLLVTKRQTPVALKKTINLLQKLQDISEDNYEAYIDTVLILADIHVKMFKNIDAINELRKAYDRFPCEKRLITEILILAKKIKKDDLVLEFSEYMEILDKDDNYILNMNLYDIYKTKKDSINAVTQLKKLINTGYSEESLYRNISQDLNDLNLTYESLSFEKDRQSIFDLNELEIFNQISRLYALKNYTEAYKLLEAALLYFHQSGNYQKEIKKYIDEYYKLIFLFDTSLFPRLGYEPEAYKAYNQQLAQQVNLRLSETIFYTLQENKI